MPEITIHDFSLLVYETDRKAYIRVLLYALSGM